MDLAVSQLVLQDRNVAHFITDRHFMILEMSGSGDILPRNQATRLGCSLLEVVPELVGTEAILQAILDGDCPRFQLPLVNREAANGQTSYLTMVDIPYYNEHGDIAGLIHIIQDDTEVGTLEQHLVQQRNELRLLQAQLASQNLALAAANAELRHLDDTKSVFVSVAAHELRTPLTAIIGYVEMLLDAEDSPGPLNQDQRDYLETVQRAGRRLLVITNNLLDVTRIEAGRLELVLTGVDLRAVVETVAGEYGPQLEARSQRLTLRAFPGLPLALVDEARAMQVIGNLLSNASKYTQPEGEISISIQPADEPGFLVVSVTDNGVGIAPNDQAKLFTRFYRAESTLLSGASGAGLGLYIARSLVELHGGQIGFESEPGRGSTFYVTFPVADPT